MRNHSIKPLIIGASLLGVAAIRLNAATAGFDVLVVDADSGTPISNVEVTGWFANSNGWKAWTESAPGDWLVCKQQWMESMDGVSANIRV